MILQHELLSFYLLVSYNVCNILKTHTTQGSRVGRCGLDSSGSGWGTLVGSCEHGNESLGSIKGREFPDC